MHAARCQDQRALCSLYVVSSGEEPETQESLRLHHYPKILSEPVEIMKLVLLSKTFSFFDSMTVAHTNVSHFQIAVSSRVWCLKALRLENS